MAIFLDANVLLRYLVADHHEPFEDCRALLANVQEGAMRPYVSSIVLLEVAYVLSSVYKVSRSAIVKDIATILELRGLVIVEETHFRDAFVLHQKTGVKLADCLIATQVSKGVTLVTYDRDFAKLPGITVKTPRDIVTASETS